MISGFRLALALFVWLLGTFFSAQALDEDSLQAMKDNVLLTKGKVRVALLQKIASVYLLERDKQGMVYAREAATVAARLPRVEDKIEAQMFLAQAAFRLKRLDVARESLQQAEELAEKLADKERAAILHEIGNNYLQLTDYADAAYRFREEIRLRESFAPDSDCVIAHRGLAQACRYLGRHRESIAHLHKAMEEVEGFSDSLLYFSLLEELGAIHLQLGENDSAIGELKNLLTFREAKADSPGMAQAHLLLAEAYHQSKQPQETIVQAKAAFDIWHSQGNAKGEAESLNILALPYLDQKKWETAVLYLEMAIEKFEEAGAYRQVPVALGNLGFAQIKTGSTEDGLRNLRQALYKARVNRMLPTEISLSEKLYQAHESLGNYDWALEYLKQTIDLKDSLFNEEKTRIIKELEIEYETQKQKKRYQALMSSQERKRFLGYLQLGGLGALLVVTLLIINRQRVIIRKDAMLHEKEKQILQTREKLTAAELKNTLSELEYNRSRLEIYMQSILAKNDMVEKLVSKLKGLGEVHPQLEGDERREKLAELIELRILTEDDWITFKDHFEQVYHGFFHRLAFAYPRLTSGEIRLFALLKLDLSTREIANILGISPDSVKKSRYRLRKKLNLQESDNLHDFIIGFN